MKNAILFSFFCVASYICVFAQDSTVLHPFHGLHVPTGLYISAFVLGALGQCISMLTTFSTLKAKAQATNLIFTFKSFWSDEWPNQIRNLCVIIIAVMFIPVVVLKKPEDIWLIRPVMPLIGFSGMTLFLQYFGVANKALNAAAGFKAQGFDQATGNTVAPTPAVKPQ